LFRAASTAANLNLPVISFSYIQSSNGAQLRTTIATTTTSNITAAVPANYTNIITAAIFLPPSTQPPPRPPTKKHPHEMNASGMVNSESAGPVRATERRTALVLSLGHAHMM